MGFLTDVQQVYGADTRRVCNQHLNSAKKIAAIENHINFLLRCKNCNIFPKHIQKNFKFTYQLMTDSQCFVNSVDNAIFNFKKTILKIEINSLHYKYRIVKSNILCSEELLRSTLSVAHFDKFIHLYNKNHDYWFRKYKISQLDKFKKLNSNNMDNTNNNINKYVTNLTTTIVPENVLKLLSYGPKFAVPYDNTELPLVQIISDVEHIINVSHKSNTDNFDSDLMRSRCINIITNHLNSNKHKQCASIDKQTVYDYNVTKKFTTEHPDLMFAKTDKSKKLIILNKDTYIDKMINMLSDPKYYTKLKKDPTESIQTKTNEFIKKLVDIGDIECDVGKKLKSYNSVSPKIYGLIKDHKQDYPLRPIVSCIHAPTFQLSKLLLDSMTHFNSTYSYDVKNSLEIVSIVQNLPQLQDNDILISLDVVSLFTNIPKELVNDVVTEKWDTLQNHTMFSRNQYINIINFIMDNSYFCFEGVYYKQIFGISMGSPISPCLANLVMNYILEVAFSKLNFTPTLVKKYVDDLLLIVPSDRVTDVLQVFNSVNSNIQFTLELEQNAKLSFLDVLLVRQNNNILTKWYRKPMASDRFLDFNSQHLLQQKINVAYNLKDKALKLTSSVFHMEVRQLVTEILSNNNFPTKLIRKIMNNNRVHRDVVSGTSSQGPTNPTYCSLTYVKGLAEPLKRCLTNNNIKVTFKYHKNVGGLLTKLKFPTPDEMLSRVIYRLSCRDCDATYTGQTQQYIKKRIRQHQYDVQRNNDRPVAKHCSSLKHCFDFDDVEILDGENNLDKRLVKEMIYIKINHNNINIQQDVENLSASYANLLRHVNTRCKKIKIK